MKKIVLGIIILAVIIVVYLTLAESFGEVKLVSTISQDQSLIELIKIKEKHNMVNGFSANQIKINSYINEISELRGKSIGEASQVINIELLHAQAFSKLLNSTNNFYDYQSSGCESLFPRVAIEEANQVQLFVNEAEKSISNVSNLKNNLRENQLLSLKLLVEKARLIKTNISKECNFN